MIYRELSIHQRINVKSWVRHDICVTCVYHSVLLYDTMVGHMLIKMGRGDEALSAMFDARMKGK